MNFGETEKIETNVRYNSNIVWRNVNILTPSLSGTMDAMFYLQAPDEADVVGLTFGTVAEEINGSFLNHGEATLTFDPATS